MSNSKLPERASLEYLKRLAKERLRELRASDAAAKLSTAQLLVAQEHGFPSWRALKAEIDRQRAPLVAAFFAACAAGDAAALRALLGDAPSLVRERDNAGRTGLHLAVAHVEAVRVLLEHGGDPNARELGDNASPLHFATSAGRQESLRAMLDAGGDVHGAGDVHQGGVIGWATGNGVDVSPEVVALLVERGARHHIFSAIALGDLQLVEQLVEEHPEVLYQRRSRFEQGQTPLHFALIAPDGLRSRPAQYELAERLIELGADVDAEDDKGRTVLDLALLHGDQTAIRLLRAAGAREPRPVDADDLEASASEVVASIQKAAPMIGVADMEATVTWYVSLGFTLKGRYPEEGKMNWASIGLGDADLMLTPGGGRVDFGLWLYSKRVEHLYQLFKARRLRALQNTRSDAAASLPEIVFNEDLYQPFYGGWQFSIRDPNGLVLFFRSV